MSACIGAQNANRRIGELEQEVDELRQLVWLLCNTLDIDCRCLACIDAVEHRDGFVVTYEEQLCLELSETP